MDNYEEICFGIISYAGTAKSCFLEAIELAKNKQNYNDIIKEGEDAFYKASKAHAKALQFDANKDLKVGLLLIHAETILSSAETIHDLLFTIISMI